MIEVNKNNISFFFISSNILTLSRQKDIIQLTIRKVDTL